MRVAPVGWARETLEEVLKEAERSAAVTHDHPEGIKGAQAIAGAVFLARTAHTKDDIRVFAGERLAYRLQGPVEALRGQVRGTTCPDTVPAALLAFLEADGWEQAVRLAVSIGGDSDTIACTAGAVAEAFYAGVPEPVVTEVWRRLTPSLQAIARAFLARYPPRQQS
jgi:ADP-ribosylglycohydrolase